MEIWPTHVRSFGVLNATMASQRSPATTGQRLNLARREAERDAGHASK